MWLDKVCYQYKIFGTSLQITILPLIQENGQLLFYFLIRHSEIMWKGIRCQIVGVPHVPNTPLPTLGIRDVRWHTGLILDKYDFWISKFAKEKYSKTFSQSKCHHHSQIQTFPPLFYSTLHCTWNKAKQIKSLEMKAEQVFSVLCKESTSSVTTYTTKAVVGE